MVTFTRPVAGEVAGARAVEWFRGIVATLGVMRSPKGDDVGRVEQEVGDTLCAI